MTNVYKIYKTTVSVYMENDTRMKRNLETWMPNDSNLVKNVRKGSQASILSILKIQDEALT
jgi:hypothetical protein